MRASSTTSLHLNCAWWHGSTRLGCSFCTPRWWLPKEESFKVRVHFTIDHPRTAFSLGSIGPTSLCSAVKGRPCDEPMVQGRHWDGERASIGNSTARASAQGPHDQGVCGWQDSTPFLSMCQWRAAVPDWWVTPGYRTIGFVNTWPP